MNGLRHPFHSASRRGSVLMLAMWVMVALSMVAGGLAFSQRVEMKLTSRFKAQPQGHYAARAGVETTIDALTQHASDATHFSGPDFWNSPKRYENIPVGPGTFTVVGQPDAQGRAGFGLDDEESRLNVNTAKTDMLAKIPQLGQQLAESIVNLRKRLNSSQGRTDPDDATDTDDSAKKKTAAAAAPFVELDELLAASGITPELLYGTPSQRGLNTLLTTKSNGLVNVNTAPLEVLLALKIESDKAQAAVSRRNPQAAAFSSKEEFISFVGVVEQPKKKKESPFKKKEDPNAKKSFKPAPKPKQETNPLESQVDVKSTNFRVVSIGRMAGSPSVVIQAQVNVNNGKVTTTTWQERSSLEAETPDAKDKGASK